MSIYQIADLWGLVDGTVGEGSVGVVMLWLARWVEMLGCLVGYIRMRPSFLRMRSSFSRHNFGCRRRIASSYQWLVDSYKLVDQVVYILVGTLGGAQLLLQQLPHVIENLFVSFVLRKVFLVVLYKLLHLLVQLFLRYLLAVDQLQVL